MSVATYRGFRAFFLLFIASACLVSCSLFGGDDDDSSTSMTGAWSEGYTCSPFAGMAVYGKYLYAADGVMGIRVYSLANPAKPVLAQALKPPDSMPNGFNDLAVGKASSGLAYLIGVSSAGFAAYSLDAPAQPALQASGSAAIGVPSAGSMNFRRVAASGNYIVASLGAVSSASAFIYLYGESGGSWKLQSTSSSSVSGGGSLIPIDAAFALSGDTPYALQLDTAGDSSSNKAMRVVAIKAAGAEGSSANFSWTCANLELTTGHASSIGAIAASGSRVVAAVDGSDHTRLYSIDFSADANGIPGIAIAGYAELDSTIAYEALEVATDGSHAYVLRSNALYGNVLYDYDVSGAPKLKGSLELGKDSDYPRALALYGGYVYYGGSSGLAAVRK